MSITGAGSITAANVQAVNNMTKQLDSLSQELGSGQASQTYSGLGSQACVVLALSGQLSALNSYSDTANTVGATLTVAQSALTGLGNTETAVQQSINQQGAFTLNANGQTSVQAAAITQLDSILSMLNTQVGSDYIFSGTATTTPSVASTNAILNGNGAQDGLSQVIQERQAADLGTGSGRLNIPPTGGGTTVSIGEDVPGSPFGFKLAGVNSSLGGTVVTGPSGSPSTISIDMSAETVNPGDSIQFDLTLPDGTSQNITLTATANSPPGANQFTVGATQATTASNLQAALSTAVGNLAQTALPAASAIAAANDFFSSNPPLRVSGPPATATALVAGTPANTVFWYTGEAGATSARQTATAQVGPGMTIAYGMRANEQALTNLVANVAAFAASTFSPTSANAQASYDALAQKVTANLAPQSGVQQISDIEADLASAQTVMTNAGNTNTQTQSALTDMMQNIDGVNQSQIGEQILTLQNSLSASLSVTARLSQLSLVNFLSPASG
jgi:flagellar hook-associated protein 3 FlgL